MYLVTAKQMQNIDRAAIQSFGIPGQVLMENAGRGAVEMFLRTFPYIKSKRVSILAGRGNNGGDGFVMARYLMEKGFEVKTFLFSTSDRVTGDAKANLLLFEKLASANSKEGVVEIPDTETFERLKDKIIHCDIFIDAILGTGLNSDVRGLFKDVIETVNSLKRAVFSVDIASGLNSDTAQIMGVAIRADATATFAFAKIGHIVHPGRELTGKLEIVDIGIPNFIADKENVSVHLIEKKDVQAIFKFRQRTANSHKGSYGHLLLVAGSIGKSGAAALAANAAMASGSGLVTLAVPESINSIVEPQVTETMTYPLPENSTGELSYSSLNLIINDLVKDKRIVAVGPGIGINKSTTRVVNGMVENITLPMVIDADGLNAVADNPYILKKRKAATILTPHPGEMSRLTGRTTAQIQQNRVETAVMFAAEFNVIVVLKGASTVIALPDGTVYICPTGNPGMASGGMGDVLTGMISGFIAQGFTPAQAAIAGVYTHGLCGDDLSKRRGAFGFVASDLIRTIPETIDEICKD